MKKWRIKWIDELNDDELNKFYCIRKLGEIFEWQFTVFWFQDNGLWQLGKITCLVTDFIFVVVHRNGSYILEPKF